MPDFPPRNTEAEARQSPRQHRDTATPRHRDTATPRHRDTAIGAAENLKVSVPERAVLEMLSEVGTHEDLEEARNLFDGLRNLRTETMGQLLACCSNVKTIRLFLAWARETGVADVDQLPSSFPIEIGSKSRWVTRLKDGTLLVLKHG